MRNSLIYAVCFLLAGLTWACSKEETEDPINTSAVKQAESFTDPRDNHVYRCIQIGDQIWMVDNLAYYLPGGTVDGCYTWNEEKLSEEEVDVSLIPAEDYERIYLEVVNDTTFNWPASTGLDTETLASYAAWISSYGNADFEKMMVRWKPALIPLFSEMLPRFVRECADVLSGPHTAEAEKANGYYSATYGYLYSLDGAKKAVPEGWRIPSDADWKKLEAVLGMPSDDLDKMDAWRGRNCGDFLKLGGVSGFNVQMAGCGAYVSGSSYAYIRKDECAYYWASDVTEVDGGSLDAAGSDEEGGEASQTVKMGIIREVAIFSSQIWRGSTRLDNTSHEVTYSVRCVRDIN